MNIIDDVNMLEREIFALKAFATPMNAIIKQKHFAVPAPDTDKFQTLTIVFADNKQAMFWVYTDDKVDIMQTTFNSSGGAVVTFMNVAYPHTASNFIILSFNDFQVS